MRRISHILRKLADRYNSIIDQLNTWQEKASEWFVWTFLWPLGPITFVLTLLSWAALVLTFLGGGIGIILVIFIDSARFQTAAELYLGGMLIELTLATIITVSYMRISLYFDERNGMY